MITFEQRGSITLVRPQDGEESDWLVEHTDGQWFGGALACEPRYVDQLAVGLEEAGFEVCFPV